MVAQYKYSVVKTIFRLKEYKNKNVHYIHMSRTLTSSQTLIASLQTHLQDVATRQMDEQANMISNQNKQHREKQKSVSPTWVPTFEECNDLLNYSLKVDDLKRIAKTYGVKQSGKKLEILKRIYQFLWGSSFAKTIQRYWRGHLVRRYVRLHGPAVKDRTICTNTDDFVTMDTITEIPFHQFISYRDEDNFVYGFHIASLYQLYHKSSGDVQNPYNRRTIPREVFRNLRRIVRIGRMLRYSISLDWNEEQPVAPPVSYETLVERHALQVFNHINELGHHYSNAQWMLSLDLSQLRQFYNELFLVWKVRAELSSDMRRQICPPLGNPFRSVSSYVMAHTQNVWVLRKIMLDLVSLFVFSGRTRDSQTLGSYYVLGALTLVSGPAATTFPVLYESFRR